MSDGWTTVGEMPAGSVFETRDGRRWVAHRFNITNTRQVFEYQNGRAVHRYLPTDTHARPLTPVPVAPALDPTLRGLLLHALETGETHALHDWLTEANGDRDLADAVRENVRRESECKTCGGAVLDWNSWVMTAPMCQCHAPLNFTPDAVRSLAQMPIHVRRSIDPDAT
jgi:hypothetical protein